MAAHRGGPKGGRTGNDKHAAPAGRLPILRPLRPHRIPNRAGSTAAERGTKAVAGARLSGAGPPLLRPNAAKLLWVHKIHVLRHPAARVRNNTDFVSSQAPNRRKLRGGAAAIAAAAQRAPNPTLHGIAILLYGKNRKYNTIQHNTIHPNILRAMLCHSHKILYSACPVARGRSRSPLGTTHSSSDRVSSPLPCTARQILGLLWCRPRYGF